MTGIESNFLPTTIDIERNTSILIESFVYRTTWIEQFYLKLGSTWILDSLYIYLHLPLAMLGFILNLVSFRTFFRLKFRLKRTYHNYLKVYTLTSCLVCFLAIFTFLLMAPRYFDFVLTSLASFYKCVISIWLSTLLYFFLNVLDCLLLVERISNLTNNKHIKSFFKYDSRIICFCLFFMCNLINLPILFMNSPRNDDYYEQVIRDEQKIENFTFCYREPFFFSSHGRLIITLVVILRDILTLLSEIFLSIYSFVLFKRYLSKRANILYLKLNLTNTATTKIENSAYVNEAIINDEIDNNNNNNTNDTLTISSDNIINSIIANNQNVRVIINKAENYNSRLTRMTIYLSIFSVMSHFCIAITFIFPTLNDKSMLIFVFSFISCFLSIAKYTLNFFLFYRFNKLFRSHLKCI